MKLDDIAPVNADKLNAKMQAMLGWSIKLEGLDAKKAVSMLESVDQSSARSVAPASCMRARRTLTIPAC